MSAKLVLRHSLAPYATLGTFFIGFTVWGFFNSSRTGNWGAFQSGLLISGIYSLQVAMGFWYRISLQDSVISQRAFGMRKVSIPLAEITSVGKEVSDVATLVRMNRPFRRICINGGNESARKTIDVSLKHFWHKDIELLMRAIHAARPELEIPKGWLT
jgi:hypothetical protein